MRTQWIYDIGAHTGDDSDYYLRKGFHVVAVEAFPDHAETLRNRFATSSAPSKSRFLATMSPTSGAASG